ncbi:uncharacterized protein LOC144129145 [Amblyomma americanum]
MAAQERCSKLAMELEAPPSRLVRPSSQMPTCQTVTRSWRQESCPPTRQPRSLWKQKRKSCVACGSLPPGGGGGGDELAADENYPRPTRRTTRASRATRTASPTRKEATDKESDCRTRAQRPRRVNKSVAVSEDPLDDDDDVACRGSVLVDDNSEFSPLKCPGEMVVGMFSRSSNDGATASTYKTRRHRLLPPDLDFFEVEDEEPPPSARKTTGRRRAKH